MRLTHLLPGALHFASALLLLSTSFPSIHTSPIRIWPSEIGPPLNVLRYGEHWVLRTFDVENFLGSHTPWRTSKASFWNSKAVSVIDQGRSFRIRNPYDRPQMIRFGNSEDAYFVAARSSETFPKTLVGHHPTFTVHPIRVPRAGIVFSE